MPQEIGFDEVRDLIDRDAQIVEVLPPAEFEEEHLPGAINIPLKTLTSDIANRLDRTMPVVLYCWDDA
ncbi:MAG: rhodanese-like domain-containing protein [Actinomycetota bacterium]|nr:rhodanese-like domain-containing protein [Actinomycetota bacterium]